MTTLTSPSGPAPSPPLTGWTVADLIDRFGPMPLWRIRFTPAPGTATEADAIAVWEREKRPCELVDGTLVEKTVGYQDAYLAALIVRILGIFVEAQGLGIVLGADGMAKLEPGLLRIPDVSFIPWDRHPDRRVPDLPYVPFAPALAVEVLSPSNTAREMAGKLDDYFRTGVRLVWYVDPRARTVEVFAARDRSTELKEGDTLDGGDVLPGFNVPVARLFEGLSSASAP